MNFTWLSICLSFPTPTIKKPPFLLLCFFLSELREDYWCSALQITPYLINDTARSYVIMIVIPSICIFTTQSFTIKLETHIL